MSGQTAGNFVRRNTRLVQRRGWYSEQLTSITFHRPSNGAGEYVIIAAERPMNDHERLKRQIHRLREAREPSDGRARVRVRQAEPRFVPETGRPTGAWCAEQEEMRLPAGGWNGRREAGILVALWRSDRPRHLGRVLCLLASLTACSKDVVPSSAVGGTRNVAASAVRGDPNTATDDRVAPALPANGVGIVIAPSGKTGDLVLRFCYAEGADYDPEIHTVVIAPIEGTTEGRCELSAIDDSWLWGEWRVGSVVDGFRINGCSRFPVGVYEIYAAAIVGRGTLRISVAPDGVIQLLPWDDLSKPPRPRCGPRRSKPRLISHPRMRP